MEFKTTKCHIYSTAPNTWLGSMYLVPWVAYIISIVVVVHRFWIKYFAQVGVSQHELAYIYGFKHTHAYKHTLNAHE